VPDLPMADRHETTLPPAPEDVAAALAGARATADADERRAVIARAVGGAPAVVEGWVELSELGRDPIERYAYARVGYHRGLDALRAHGWGGRGLVRWSTPSNRPFLRCLVQLRAAAAEIGEASEVERLTTFLHDLDPDWDDAVVTG
jgi:hypothetical protein